MSEQRKSPRRRSSAGKNIYVTKSGKSIKLNRSFGERWQAKKDERTRRKAEYLSTLPINRFKRFLFRLHPKRLVKYWFSREGAIMFLKLIGIGIVVSFLLLIGMFAYFRKDLPNIKDISGSNLGGSITYYDSTGNTKLFQDYNAIKRTPVSGSAISPYMKNATIAIEDKNFYHEGAFDVRGIARATYHDVFHSGGGLQGGSTITQQLVKLNENWTANRTVSRKIKEIILAVELEREYSKDDILNGYLNIAPYGGIEYGVEAAANDYFHTSASQLTLPEAAMLAALPQSPDIYSPNSPDFDRVAFLNRQHYILDQMALQGLITKQQATDAKKVDILALVQPISSKYQNITAPYFVLAAKNELENKYGAATVNRGGWKVITTLKLNLQTSAEKLVAQNLPNLRKNGGDEEALVTEDVKTGQIVALVGGTDFNNADHGQINYAQTNIPPGSSFKPYDYASLINFTTNSGAGSVLYDTQQALPGYPCTNKTLPPPKGQGNCLEDYDFRYPGPLTLRYALAGSRNVPAVKAMLTVGTDKVISTADAMMNFPNAYNCYSDEALTHTTQCYGSSAIGDGAYLHLDQHVNGLATLARLGQAIPETYILKITDANGKTIDQWSPPASQQVLKPDSAYIVDSMLSDPNASYLPTGYKFQHYKGWNFAVKTGTTNDNFDGLMMSWSTQYAVGSWVGYHTRNHALTAGAMEYLTEPLTKGMIETATDQLNMSPVNWQQPSDIKTLPAYVVHSHVGVGSVEPSPSNDIFPSWYVSSSKSTSASQTIDKVSGNLATSCTPDLAKQTTTTSNDNAFSSDIFYPPGHPGAQSTTTTTAQDTVHNCSDTPPNVTVTSPDTACDTSTSCSFKIVVTQGTHALRDPAYPQYPGTVNLLVNGKVVNTVIIQDTDCTSASPAVCNLTIPYTPTSDQAGNSIAVTANATDSVLYQGVSGVANVNVPAAPSSNPSNNPPNNNGQNNNGHGQ